MKRNIIWARSGLKKGDRIVANIQLQSDKRPEYIEYLEDIPCGMIVRLVYDEETGRSYRTTINWSSIYCGHMRVYTADGTPIRAYNLSEMCRVGNDNRTYPLSEKDTIRIAG